MPKPQQPQDDTTLVPGMSTEDDLQAAGDYDQAQPTDAMPEGSPDEEAAESPDQEAAEGDAGAGDAGGAPNMKICIEVTPKGEITVYDEGGVAKPYKANGLDDALKAAGGMAKELSQHMAAQAMKARATGQQKQKQLARPGNADAQKLWDEMAAQRGNRGNT
jgi:hypothetical protein